MKQKKVKRKPSEVVQALENQVRFLRSSCRGFDEGDEAEAQRLAATIRVLVHDLSDPKRSRSRSLLSQLGSRFNWRFADSAYPFSERNRLIHHGLVGMRMSNSPPRATYIPKCLTKAEDTYPLVPFHEWWQQAVVFKDKKGRRFTRREIVLSIADQDGGTHLDEELDESYADLSRENSMGLRVTSGGKELPWSSNPVPPAVRQIAHEILTTIEKAGLVNQPPGPGS
jgi:hypothetical protein